MLLCSCFARTRFAASKVGTAQAAEATKNMCIASDGCVYCSSISDQDTDISNILWLFTAAYSPRRHGAYLVCKHRRTADKHQPIQARESHGINTAPVTDYTTHISNSSSDQKKCSNKRITQSSFTEKPHLHD